MTSDDWKNISNDRDRFPGPTAVLVSGYGDAERSTIRRFLDEQGYAAAPLKPCTKAQLDVTLSEVLADETVGEPLGEGVLPYAMVLSGLTYPDVQHVLKQFKTTGLPRPIFATTTETNLSFTVKTLLMHLLEEQRAVREGGTPTGG